MKDLFVALAVGVSLAACSTNGIQSQPEPISQSAVSQGHNALPSYKWEEWSFEIGPSTRFDLAHSCPKDYPVVLAGGYRVKAGHPEILGSYPNGSSTAWYISGYNHDASASVKLTIHELCAQKAI